MCWTVKQALPHSERLKSLTAISDHNDIKLEINDKQQKASNY